MQSGNTASIPQRPFGNTGVKVSAPGMGGHHLGDAEEQPAAVRLVHEAIDGGVTFFDNRWEYDRGKSEDWMAFENDPDLFIRPGGAAEALEQAKKQGKVRFTCGCSRIIFRSIQCRCLSTVSTRVFAASKLRCCRRRAGRASLRSE